ncbi:hypothetical protein BDN70DRAFT_887395 [Pholiota conissans]|uniref:Heterokaryon incompatibility domain-containing protein n=1 Tax=Pholiota conissans TaxID=109636 RepID=A0A9P5YLN4_9AGAR|nr:hypothetical protein BDN70DRAFT_887395 [Pholiota conissans]
MSASAELFERAMTSLRTHIFDELPIRLLYFQRRDSGLDIAVLDRAGVYSHLSSKLRRLFNNEPLLAPRIVDWKTVSGWVSHLTSYAILSHVWLRTTPSEVTYNGWHQDSLDLSHPGYNKITNFCSVAEAEHDVSLGWMDTVCIDKSSSAELDESIRSMYKWYQNAKVCITYLSTTITLEDMDKDAWFTRGWTLQELFAPKRTKFYDAHWKILVKGLDNDKEDTRIQKIIQSATSITPIELTSTLWVPISRKMQWAAKRCVSRGEDSAYSLMGIFHVTNMSIAYGEGAQLAFIRLLKEILSTTKTHVADLFNWGGEYTTTTSAVLPSNPLAYLMRSSAVTDMIRRVQATEPIILTHLGLRIPVLLLPATVGSPTPFESIGDYYANTTIQPSSRHQITHSYHILDAQTRGKLAAWVFVVLNCGSDDNNVHISKECFAVLFRDPTHSVFTYVITSTGLKEKISTKEPIVFQLNSRTASLPQRHYTIQKNQLGRHGMQFSSMYL